MPEMNKSIEEQELSDMLLGYPCNQAGYLPIPLQCVPSECLRELELHLYNGRAYSLYRNIGINFSPRDYRRLVRSGVEFVYIPVKDHMLYYRTIERHLTKIIKNPRVQIEKKSEILYATSLELAHQLLSNPLKPKDIDRTGNVVDGMINFIMQDKAAFSKLFEISNHDFYTATHMINVCSLTLAYAHQMGIHDKAMLRTVGTGALLHDIGKIFVPAELLNSSEPPTKEELAQLHAHVERGCEYLAKLNNISSEAMMIVGQHHERMDGSGYPRRLRGGQISILGRIVGVVDTFDAMTSVRPYRAKTYSVEEALRNLYAEAPQKYDLTMVQALERLIHTTLGIGKIPGKNYIPTEDNESNLSWLIASGFTEKRRYVRHYFRMEAILRRIKRIKDSPVLGNAEKVIIHNISCCGVGLLSQRPLRPGENVCLSILGKGDYKIPPFIGIVIRCDEHQDGWYTVGIDFYKPLSAEIIHKIKSPNFIRRINSLTK
jgi:HD-GYP domain-containing protein (c-di-GMP phosphodiesterase class II)